MRFEIYRESLLEMFKKLLVGRIFSTTTIIQTEGTIFSIDEWRRHRQVFRYAKFYPEWFEEITQETDAVVIDIAKASRLVKLAPRHTKIIVEKRGSKLCFTDDDGTTNLHYEEPEKPLMTQLPFEIKPLDVVFTLDLAELKDIAKSGDKMKTTEYRFAIRDDQVLVNIEDPKDDRNEITRLLNSSEIISGTDLDTYFLYGISDIARTFQEETFTVHTSTHSPGWFTEGCRHLGYEIGVLVPTFPSTSP